MATNNFKTFLETYYQNTYSDPLGKKGDNSLIKVNGCIKQVGGLENSQLIILSTDCYSKLLQTNDLQIYSECLQSFNFGEEQLSAINVCINQNPSNCVNGATLGVANSGDIIYTDCCGNQVIEQVGRGTYDLQTCLTIDTIEPFTKGGSPAFITNISYNGLNCNCKNLQ